MTTDKANTSEPKVLHEWTADGTPFRIFLDTDGVIYCDSYDHSDEEWIMHDEPALIDELMRLAARVQEQAVEIERLTKERDDARRALAEIKRAVLAEIVDMLVEEHLKPTVYDELKRRVEGL